MMYEFLTSHRDELVDRCSAKVAMRSSPKPIAGETDHGISPFLDELIETLKIEQTSHPLRSRRISGPAGGGSEVPSEIGATASRHGRKLMERGFTVEQVVHDYGDVCQAITDLAFEKNFSIEVDEFRTLNRCLDNGIANAVTEFIARRDILSAIQQSEALKDRGIFVHELRNFLHTAGLALRAIRAGDVGLNGATGAVLDRSLAGMASLIDRSLDEVRATARLQPLGNRFSLADFIAEVQLSASLEAVAKECSFTVSSVDPTLAVDGNRVLLLSALGNLLQNAFKFTRRHTGVTLKAYAAADRILIDIEDQGGGLPSGGAEKLFEPFLQSGEDRTGLGLGLLIARGGVELNDGTLIAKDVPGSGCIFTINLPLYRIH